MLVRIRFGKPLKVGKQKGKHRKFALALGAIMTPAALMALVLAAWRIAADLNWTKSFAIPSGPFSHWQVWLGASALLQLGSRVLNRYASKEDARIS